jgi:predicted hotdog family 3-hydroxylacyl-ACP dehydratase
MTMDRARIETLIPQQGAMCLIDRVDFWDGQRIICFTMQHVALTNPLRTPEGLSSLHGIEFAAQAMAVHGGLTATGQRRPRVGLLLSARDCRFHRKRLDDIAGPLTIEAEQMGNHEDTRLYRFKVHTQDALLVEGRAAVMMRDGAMS